MQPASNAFNGPIDEMESAAAELEIVSDSPNQLAFDMASAGIELTTAGPGPNKNDDGGNTVLDRPPETKDKARNKARRPKMYKVLLHNDDVTPFEWVTHMLKKHFDVKPATAEALMYLAHTTGMAVVCVMSKELAAAKTTAVMEESAAKGHPLTMSYEPET